MAHPSHKKDERLSFCLIVSEVTIDKNMARYMTAREILMVSSSSQLHFKVFILEKTQG